MKILKTMYSVQAQKSTENVQHTTSEIKDRSCLSKIFKYLEDMLLQW